MSGWSLSHPYPLADSTRGWPTRTARFVAGSGAERAAAERRLETAGPTPSFATIPTEVARLAVRRVRLVSAVLLVVLSGVWWLVLLVQGNVRQQFQQIGQWGPPVLAIGASLAVFGITFARRVPATRILAAGMIYQALASFAIAFGQYVGTFTGLSGHEVTFDRFGISWVALWMLFHAALVPAQPRTALLGLVPSAAAVPVAVIVSRAADGLPAMEPSRFVLLMVLPYVVTAVLAYWTVQLLYGARLAALRARQLGSYVLEEQLGNGGMGEVWRARHELLARPAAVKIIRPELLGGDAKAFRLAAARFEEEARVTAALRSPHTVELYDFGTSADGTLYYVMELLDGIDLESLVQRHGPLPPERAIYLLRQACGSLAEAHGLRLIHRDVKPANMFLCRCGLDHDFVKLLDFGLVQHRPPNVSGTLPGVRSVVVGTPAYMAPEVAQGKRADERSDVYALGCVAYWLLTGQLVFGDRSAPDTMMAHVHERPARPSTRTEQSVPHDLEDLIMACLVKDPHGRIQTAQQLAEGLGRIELGPTWTNAQAAQWWELHRPSGPVLAA